MQYVSIAWSTCYIFRFHTVFSSDDLCLHFPDQFCQLFLTLGFRFRVDVPGHALAVDDGGVAALPQVVIDLANASGAWFAPLSLVGWLTHPVPGLRRCPLWAWNVLGGGFWGATSRLGFGSALPIPLSILSAALCRMASVTWV